MFHKYYVVKPLGSGQSSTVYLVKHIKLQILRAIKCIKKDNPYYKQLINEAHILKNLKHPNIPVIYDIEEDEFYSYIIEEYIEGQSLKAFRLSCDTIREDMIIKFSIQICELIEYLHSKDKKILYLDLKPENIIFDGVTLKLIDFGTATYYEEVDKRKFAIGTRGYASPEQYKAKKLDERSDVYSVGMLMFFLVTAITFPIQKNEIINIDEEKNCSKELKTIINKCLKYNPTQRYQTIYKLKNKLLELANKKQRLKNHIGKQISRKSLTISIAGSESRIGTTHIALLITSYINRHYMKCLYQEYNNSHTVKSILKRYENLPFKNKIYRLHHCFLMPMYNERITFDVNEYQIIIKDFGVIKEENMREYLSSNYCLIVLGTKDWELDQSEECLKKFQNIKDIYYLFNFIDGKTFQNIMKSMGNEKCYRIPYEVNPFGVNKTSGIKELIEELLH